ncbi:hypothetical protein HD806DRAFT_527197 [Xylariaceae sp. AK1471]|nr:hypothetical protein HD806DRAFT_527197 [Xylariaceae sp. AK1471]
MQSDLFTRCNSGRIGASLTSVFRESGYNVFPTASSPRKIDEGLTRISNVHSLALDTYDVLNVLVSNADGNLISAVLDANAQQGRDLFDTNFWTRRTIVNISSITGVYVSKAALASLSETLRLEMQPLGVHVMTVMFSLPLGPLYGPINSAIADVAVGKKGGGQCSEEMFSDEVVKAVETGTVGLTWNSALASL